MELEPGVVVDIDVLLEENYIIPIWNWSSCFASSTALTFSNYIIPIWNWSVFLFYLLCVYNSYYIIPIWNWSNLILFLLFQSKYITLFLYGIGATLDVVNSCNSVGLHYSYMELELFPFCLFKLFCLYYIIPIWNWSKNIQVIVLHKILITLFLYGIGAYTDIIHCPLKDGNYIIPIWNWSKSKNSSFSN